MTVSLPDDEIVTW